VRHARARGARSRQLSTLHRKHEDGRSGSRTVVETRLRRFEDMSLAPYKAAAGRRPSAAHAVCQFLTLMTTCRSL